MELTQADARTLMRFETNEGVCLKALFERLQRFRDCCLEFRPSTAANGKGGIFMDVMTTSGSTVAILSLDKLDKYNCNTHISMGIEVYAWFKLFKKVTRDDTVVLKIDHDGFYANQPYATVYVYNPIKEVLVDYMVYFLDIQLERFEIPERKFDAIVSVGSLELFKVLRWCETAGLYVQLYTSEEGGKTYLVVETVNTDLTDSQSVVVKVRINITNHTDTLGDKNVRSNNSYKLEHLLDIARSGSMNMGGNAIVYLTRDEYPLVLDYNVGTMGTLKYCVGPVIETEAQQGAATTTKTTCDSTETRSRKRPRSVTMLYSANDNSDIGDIGDIGDDGDERGCGRTNHFDDDNGAEEGDDCYDDDRTDGVAF